MLNHLKRLISPAREPDVAEVREVATPAAVEPEIDIGLIDIHQSGWLQNETGELVRGFAITADDVVLDIGCGEGGYALFSARQQAEIILADVNAPKLEIARARLEKEGARSVRTLVTDANPIPLDDGVISRVVAMEVLEHVEDPAQFMDELVRVAKPGALFLLTVPDEVIEGVQKHIAPPVYFERPNHIRIFKRGELEHLALEAGLSVESSMQYGFYHAVWWSLYWACENQPLSPPWHPLLENWAQTWTTLLSLPAGPRIKTALDAVMPKSQVVVARKP